MQIENVSKTNGANKIFEGRITAKSGSVKIHLKFVAFSTPQNRHVRESIGFMQRAEQCKRKEISIT